MPENREFLHWLLANVPGAALSKGNSMADYMGPAAPPHTGLHRYIFLVYSQSDKFQAKEVAHRSGFHSREFAKEHGLHLVGVNWFKSQYQ